MPDLIVKKGPMQQEQKSLISKSWSLVSISVILAEFSDNWQIVFFSFENAVFLLFIPY